MTTNRNTSLSAFVYNNHVDNHSLLIFCIIKIMSIMQGAVDMTNARHISLYFMLCQSQFYIMYIYIMQLASVN